MCITVSLRTIQRTAAVLSHSIDKALNINEAHFSDVNFAIIPSGYIVPKGSPLRVS